MERLNFEDKRLWKGLLVLGILLNVIVCFTSDLGLDTQVKMAVDDDGSLPWGDLRPDITGPVSYTHLTLPTMDHV